MSEKKSLVEEALLQMKNLEHVVTENAKGILASTMKEEIEELVKESLDETEIYVEDEDEDSLDAMGIEGPMMGDEMPDDSDSMNMGDMGLEDDEDEDMWLGDIGDEYMDEDILIQFLNEYYVVFPKKLPDAESE
mgnify:CR=1 FL=1